MNDDTIRFTRAHPLPGSLLEAARELAARTDGHALDDEHRRAGSSRWAPFGFLPLVFHERGSRGLLAPADPSKRSVWQWPVAWWDAARGQLSPLASNPWRDLEHVRAGLRLEQSLTESEAEQAVELDPWSPRALVASAVHLLDRGDPVGAEELLRRAEPLASWWMAAPLLLSGIARVNGRLGHAATWCSLALQRRWDATGATTGGAVARFGAEPRRVLRAAVAFLQRHEVRVSGLIFDPAWRRLREAADPLSPAVQAAVARELWSTGRREQAAARWEWLALSRGHVEAAWRAEQAHAALGWSLHRSHARLLRLAVGR